MAGPGLIKRHGGLFTLGTRDICFDDGEFYGIGLLLKKIGEELKSLESLLRCGVESCDENSEDGPSNSELKTNFWFLVNQSTIRELGQPLLIFFVSVNFIFYSKKGNPTTQRNYVLNFLNFQIFR